MLFNILIIKHFPDRQLELLTHHPGLLGDLQTDLFKGQSELSFLMVELVDVFV